MPLILPLTLWSTSKLMAPIMQMSKIQNEWHQGPLIARYSVKKLLFLWIHYEIKTGQLVMCVCTIPPFCSLWKNLPCAWRRARRRRSFCRRPPPCGAAESPASPGAYSAAAFLWHGTCLLCKSSELSDLSWNHFFFFT